MAARKGSDRAGARVADPRDPEALIVLDEHERVVDWNNAATLILGYTRERAVGRDLGPMIVPAERLDEHRRRFAGLLEPGGSPLLGEPFESRVTRAGGEWIDVLVRITRTATDPFHFAVSLRELAPEPGERPRGRARPERRGDGAETWARRIDRALQEDGFRLAAQPIVDLRTGKIDHHELLLRMRLEDRFALPGEFVAYAEESGQITEIDLLVARRGLQLARRFPVAINVSAAGLEGEHLLGVLLEGLEGGAVPAGNLTVEITESAAADDLDKAVDFAELVVDMGCAVSLDDFGTGYGTFTYLNKLPASELKIDRSFVRSLATSEGDRRIVDTILEIAANFGMRTVAEGVEDEAVRRYLLSSGADLGQGHLLGRPAILGSERAEPLGL